MSSYAGNFERHASEDARLEALENLLKQQQSELRAQRRRARNKRKHESEATEESPKKSKGEGGICDVEMVD